jgi:quaternary ammonium compound-resistance protein SugE
MQWLFLFVAGLFEVCWAVGLKYSLGFTKLVPSVITTLGMIASIYFLALALKSLPLGTAYAIWTGIGTVGTTIFGMVFNKEPIDTAQLVFLGLIITGIAGLKLLSPH